MMTSESGARIKARRESLKLSASELARRLEVDRTHVWNWENKGDMPRPETMVKLVQILNTSADYLLGLSDNPDGSMRVEEVEEPSWAEMLKKAIDATAAAIEYQRVTFVEAVETQRKESNTIMATMVEILDRMESRMANIEDRLPSPGPQQRSAPPAPAEAMQTVRRKARQSKTTKEEGA